MKVNGLLSEEYAATVCRFGQGSVACSFLMLGPNGLECAKTTGFERLIRDRREEKSIRARGDNCSGPPLFVIMETV